MITEYYKLCNKYSNISNNEESHILQDKIYRKFINDIVHNKIKSNQIKQIAELLKKNIVNYDKNRWYA